MSVKQWPKPRFMGFDPVNDNIIFDALRWPSAQNCFVYLMVADFEFHGDGPRELVKVGISSNPRGRMAGFQTATPFKIELYKKWRMPDRNAALWVEKKFHAGNDPFRTNGEWFRTYATGAACELDSLALWWWQDKTLGDDYFNYGGCIEFLMFSGLSFSDAELTIEQEYGPLNTWGA